MRHDGVLGNTNRIRFDIFGEVGGLNLPQNAFVEGTIAFGLSCQFLVTDGGAIQRQGGALLLMKRWCSSGVGSMPMTSM